jgi:membrane-bound lytic murein transglycosylase B
MKPLRILLIFIAFIITAQAWDTQQFAHLGPWERYAPLFSELEKKGVKKDEIRRLFTSEKSRNRDEKTLRLLSSVANIPQLRKKEREATKKFLAATPVLVRHLEKYGAVYDKVEARYGVNREIIGALLQKESALGSFTAFPHDAFVVFNTMLGQLKEPKNAAKREKLRTKRLVNEARASLAALILYAKKRGIDASAAPIPSSYAGAMGIPQFTPPVLRDAVAADGGMADLMKMEDAIFSVANLLVKRKRWPKAMLDFSNLDTLNELVTLWCEYDDGRSNLAFNTNLEGLAVKNFSHDHANREDVSYLNPYIRSLMRYNYSSDYALGILQIARAAALAQKVSDAR